MNELLHLETHEVEDVVIDQIAFGQRDDPAGNPEQAANFEVLARLGFDGFVGGDDEKHQIDAGDAREHVFDEPLVAGNVDEADIAPRCGKMREAEIDRDASAFFLLQAIRIDARKRAHQRSLAVIDVTGGSDNDAVLGQT